MSPNLLETQKVERTLSTVLRAMIKEIPDPARLPSDGEDSTFQPLPEEPETKGLGQRQNSGSGGSSNGGSPERNRYRRPKKMMSMIATKDDDVRIY